MRLAYLVSRFPVATETFILRELNAVQDELGEPVELLSLFPPETTFAHPAAEPWIPRLRQAGLRSHGRRRRLGAGHAAAEAGRSDRAHRTRVPPLDAPPPACR